MNKEKNIDANYNSGKGINRRLEKFWNWIGLKDKSLFDILEKLWTPLAVVIVAGMIDHSLKIQEINSSIASQQQEIFQFYLNEIKSELKVVAKTTDSKKIVYVLDDLQRQKMDALTRIYTRYTAPKQRGFIILTLYEFGLINHERDEVKKYTLATRRYF